MAIRKIIFRVGLSCTGVLAMSGIAHAGQINGVEFKSEDNQSRVEISGDGLGAYKKEVKTNPPQLVLTFPDSTIAEDAAKKLDTSSFKGSVLQVSSYPLSGDETGSRVVVDLKAKTNYTVDEADGKLIVKVNEVADNGADANAEVAAKPTTNKETTKEAVNSDALSAIMNAQDEKKFTGSPITLKLKDADVHEVLRLISMTSGFNIVIHPQVQGKLTLSLDGVPWDQALEVVLTTLKLSAERNASVLRVMPRDLFIAEKQQQLDEQKLSAVAAPRITSIFPISYSDLNDLAALLQNFANSQNTTPGSSGIPATILVDKTTQSLIVRDTADSLAKIKKMIELLDVQTPQVLVEGKVVEATNEFTKTLGGSFGIGGNRYGFAFNGPASLLGVPNIGSPIGSKGGGLFSGADVFQVNGRAISIASTLSMSEKDNKIKVVSSPRTVVLSGKTASISQATTVGIQVTTPGTATSPPTTTIQSATANTKLNVTPRVTNDGSVLMKIDLTRDILNLTNPLAPVAEPRQMATEVIVDSGTTLVIGGVLNLDENHVEEGVPILRRIPLIGWLFGDESDDNLKSELMFFVTPRVLNSKRTGLIMDVSAPPAKL